ncbi:hypothetical protein [Halorussus caseinilyticus]|uniref:hypothetical protein n=1 Tax=Halorussus caseinilyticus TaxID=3034025 RepID=UPI0023E8C807|nr:hypothetical protein [Halorussus sp. DT72]
MSDADEREIDRRSILKAGAAGIATLASGSTLVAANRSDKASDVHVAKGTINNPVSDQRRKQLRKRAVKEYERNTGETLDGIPAVRAKAAHGPGDSPEDGASFESEVVAYAYGIDANGTARGYIGMAGEAPGFESNGRAEEGIHNRFEDRVQEVSDKLEASDDDLSTQTAGNLDSLENMEAAHDFPLEHQVYPHGRISSTCYWLQDTVNSDEATLHGFHTPMTIEPGTQVKDWDSNWQNKSVRKKHLWDKSEMNFVDVRNGYWRPAGPSDGGSSTESYSVSASFSLTDLGVSTSMSWGYTNPAMERSDNSSEWDNYCDWSWNINDRCGDSVRTSTLTMEPSSKCEQTDYDCGMGERDICSLELKATFTDGSCGDGYWLKSWDTAYKHC